MKMPSITKHLIAYGLGALALLTTLWLWHEKDKEVDALNTKFNRAQVLLQEKDKQIEREQVAIVKRDDDYAKQDEKFQALERGIKTLAKDNKEIRAVLSTVVPTESLRGLRSYGGKHKSESP